MVGSGPGPLVWEATAAPWQWQRPPCAHVDLMERAWSQRAVCLRALRSEGQIKMDQYLWAWSQVSVFWRFLCVVEEKTLELRSPQLHQIVQPFFFPPNVCLMPVFINRHLNLTFIQWHYQKREESIVSPLELLLISQLWTSALPNFKEHIFAVLSH